MKIEGGYILLSRKIIESEIFDKPPLYLKVWVYLLSRARFKGRNGLSRGEFRTTVNEIRKACSWKSGYRTIAPKRRKIYRIIKWMKKPTGDTTGDTAGDTPGDTPGDTTGDTTGDTMLSTKKITHGFIINIEQYERYQDPDMYKNSNKKTTNHTTNGGNNKEECNKDNKDKKENKESKEKKKRKDSQFAQHQARPCFAKKLEYSDHVLQKSSSTSDEDEGTQPWRNKRWTKSDYKLSKKVLVYQNKQFPKVVDKDEESIQKGANTIRLMRNDGKLTKKEILGTLRFGVKDKKFWHDKILSVANLRNKSKRNGKMKIINIYNSWQKAQRDEEGNKKKTKSTKEIMKEAMNE